MSKSITLITLAFLFGGQTENPEDELCDRLNRFERQVSRSAVETASIKVIWDWANWTVVCAHYGQPAANQLCRWLPRNMSREFPSLLVGRVFVCYGIEDHSIEIGRFEAIEKAIRTKAGNRARIETGGLELDDELPWMRLTVEKLK